MLRVAVIGMGHIGHRHSRIYTANPKVEVLAVNGSEFMRYDGVAKVVKNEEVLK